MCVWGALGPSPHLLVSLLICITGSETLSALCFRTCSSPGSSWEVEVMPAGSQPAPLTPWLCPGPPLQDSSGATKPGCEP